MASTTGGDEGNRNPLRDFREGFIAGASQRPSPGDMSLDWNRGWNIGRSSFGEAMRNESRRLQVRVECPGCGRFFDNCASGAVSKAGQWFCSDACAKE